MGGYRALYMAIWAYGERHSAPVEIARGAKQTTQSGGAVATRCVCPEHQGGWARSASVRSVHCWKGPNFVLRKSRHMSVRRADTSRKHRCACTNSSPRYPRAWLYAWVASAARISVTGGAIVVPFSEKRTFSTGFSYCPSLRWPQLATKRYRQSQLTI